MVLEVSAHTSWEIWNIFLGRDILPYEFSSAFNFSKRCKVLQNATAKGCRGTENSRSIIWVACYYLSFEDSIYVNLKRV